MNEPKWPLPALWLAILLPPSVAFFGTWVFLIANIIVTAIAIFVGLFLYLHALDIRYPGRPRFWSGVLYFIGQSAICLAAGWGACVRLMH